MIYKYILSILGDNFCPDKIIENIQDDFVINTCFKPTDKKPINISEEYGYGGMSFMHPNKCCTEEDIIEYDKGFVEFIEKNLSVFTENVTN